MTYNMKPLACDPARIKGMSERMIISHCENSYGGAVKRLNLIGERLAELDYANAPAGAGASVSGHGEVPRSARSAASRRLVQGAPIRLS